MKMTMRRWALAGLGATLVMAGMAGEVWATAGGAVVVEVRDAEGQALPGATVALLELGHQGVTDGAGLYTFASVPDGGYHVRARLLGFTSTRAEVTVAGAAVRVVLALGDQVHFTESVTVSPQGHDAFEAYQATSVLAAEDLQVRLEGSLGETLRTQPGVNARSFGPGAARPVIRGLDGDRVLVLENGARTGDLSSQSGDHGVTLDPGGAARIEVVRGPATLLYGSNALGGVVNVIAEDVPQRPVDGLHGAVSTRAGTADESLGLAGGLSFGDSRWAGRVYGSVQRSGDAGTPAGDVPNSHNRTAGGGAALARTGAQGHLGLAYQYVDSAYGVPFVEEGGTTLDPRRHRVDLRAERRGLRGLFEGVRLQAGWRHYRHEEIEADGAVATAFRNELLEAQVLANHRPLGRLTGTLGVWAAWRDFRSAGEEALAPPTTQEAWAAFLYEELKLGHWALQFGGRVEHNRFEPDAAALPEREGLDARGFTSFSGSLGVVGHLQENLTLAVSLARAVRSPSLEELYNFGPHAGNFAFEIGNPALTREAGLGLDVALRYRSPRFTGEATYFHNRIDGFIFPFPTGEEEDELPVVNFRAADSLLRGFELHADLGLSSKVWLELGADGVHGGLRDDGRALPRMPPYRGSIGVRYEHDGFHLEGELRAARRQERVFGAETATPGYALVNLHASYKFTRSHSVHTVTLRLDNATDRLHRNHLSYVKDLVPEAGRSLKLVYGVRF